VIVLALVDVLTQLRSQQDILEARIREALLAHPDGTIFTSLPRAGTVSPWRWIGRAARAGRSACRHPAGTGPGTRGSADVTWSNTLTATTRSWWLVSRAR
jgi:transposase